MADRFVRDQAHARQLDAADPLASYRSRFRLCGAAEGEPRIYFAGHSLGLQPVGVGEALNRELEDWARLGVDAHFEGRTPWYSYHETVRQSGARLVGAQPDEVVMMNGLTVNLHLMMVSFYRPSRDRHKILMETAAFPSDTYAVQSQIRFHGYDPADALLVAGEKDREAPVPIEEIERILERRGGEIALILLPGVNYYSGQVFDLERITALGHEHGCIVGFDLAHAAGNLPLRLHDWDVDFAVWCSYKYLNAGPGAVAGCFVHERHAHAAEMPRFAGWWGNEPDRRFRMHLEREFVPQKSADGWQLSNPPILAMAPLHVSLEIFDEVGISALRGKSCRMTEYLQAWIDHVGDARLETLTPRDPDSRGCQTSIRVRQRAKELFAALERGGVVGDFRPPDVIRVAPVPLYNTFHEIWRFGQLLGEWSAR